MPELESEPSILTLRYENSRPVELTDLTTSLQAVARRFSRFATQNDLDLDENSTKLYVRKISEGSILVDLTNTAVEHAGAIASVAGASFAITKFNMIVSFAKNLRDGLQYLVGSDLAAREIATNELKDLSKIMEPVANDGNGNVTISAAEGSNVQVSVTFNSLEANAIQNRVEKEIESRREPTQTNYKRVLMYWHQASKTSHSKTDKAIIEKISDKPLKVTFNDNMEIKAKMLSGKDNPFNIGFLVDVEVVLKQGKLAYYEVTHLYEVLNEDE